MTKLFVTHIYLIFKRREKSMENSSTMWQKKKKYPQTPFLINLLVKQHAIIVTIFHTAEHPLSTSTQRLPETKLVFLFVLKSLKSVLLSIF